MPVDKDNYNVANCGYMTPVYSYNDDGADDDYDTTEDNVNCYDPATRRGAGLRHRAGLHSYHHWDIAYSETWGPPYDPTSKLWDMTHGHFSGWCSQEADAPAVTNMASMDYRDVRTRSAPSRRSIDPTAREALYTEVLTTLHNEAIFLPLTAKRQTAVTSTQRHRLQVRLHGVRPAARQPGARADWTIRSRSRRARRPASSRRAPTSAS